MSFTPITSAIGALFIQLSTTNHYKQLGETIGFSSVLSSSFFKLRGESISVILGLVGSAIVVKNFATDFVPSIPASNLLSFTSAESSRWFLYSLAGFLAGVGTKLGCGCTSGHMIGGLSRLRARSLAAVATFSGVAMLVVKYLDLGNQFDPMVPNYYVSSNDGIVPTWIYGLLGVSAFLTYVVFPKINIKQTKLMKLFYNVFDGFLFGIGLHVSGMLDVTKTIGFLSLLTPAQFDPSLIMIVLFTIIPNIFIWRRVQKPILTGAFNCANSTEISTKFLLGNAIFGVGWGLLGVCPGPGMIDAFYFTDSRYWVASFLVGNFLAGSF